MLKIDKIQHTELDGVVNLPGSKSIGNRYLLMKAVAGAELDFLNLPDSNDILVFKRCLSSETGDCFFEDAGTPLRFYLAYAALRGNNERVIDGFERLRARPIKPLLEALESCGAVFKYLKEDYSLPLKVIQTLDKDTRELTIPASISSQFVSALMLIAPYFNFGLTIRLRGEMRSAPYVDMTRALMDRNGVRCESGESTIKIGAGQYLFDTVEIESDWSAAAFFYSLMAVGRRGEILLKGLFRNSTQGDSEMVTIYNAFGINSTFEEGGVRIRCEENCIEKVEIDIKDTPDMFPALCATLVSLRIPSVIKGVRNLRDKESDRVSAMAYNAKQMGAEFTMEGDDVLSIEFEAKPQDIIQVKAYGDHRIAMACSVFALKSVVIIDTEEVVSKSFPAYWEAFNNLYGDFAKKVSE